MIRKDDMKLKAWHCSNSDLVKDGNLDLLVCHDLLNMVWNLAVEEQADRMSDVHWTSSEDEATQ